MFDGNSDRDIQQQARYAEEAMTPPNLLDVSGRSLQQFLTICALEIVWECARRAWVNAKAEWASESAPGRGVSTLQREAQPGLSGGHEH